MKIHIYFFPVTADSFLEFAKKNNNNKIKNIENDIEFLFPLALNAMKRLWCTVDKTEP